MICARLNDFFAETDFLPDTPERLTEILSVYKLYGVRTLLIAYDYDPHDSVSVHITKRTQYVSAAVVSAKGFSLKPKVVSAVPLFRGLSDLDNLHRLTLKTKKYKYIFLRIAPNTSTELVISELHRLTSKLNIIPVFINFAAVSCSVYDSTYDTLLRVPNAIYQFDLSNISSKDALLLIKEMILNGKNVAFGTGKRFDTCPYANLEYYTKRLFKVLGRNNFALFVLRQHNNVIR